MDAILDLPRPALAVVESARTQVRQGALPPAIEASRHDFHSPHGGRMHYYADGPQTGRPLVLIHSVNAAPSAHEMKPLFERYRGERPVFAPDLPGFGHSDRGDQPYSPQLYAQAIAAFLNQVVQAPADVVAFSLGCEFAAQATLLAPTRVASLVLLSPTGFSLRRMPQGPAARRLNRVLRTPVLNDGLFGLLTTRPSIRYFYGQAFVGDTPPELVEYAHATAHQPGAKYAPVSFLSGLLFHPRAIAEVYAPLTQPVLVLHDRDPNIGFELLPDFLAQHPNWRVERIAPTAGLPQWEKPQDTAAAMDRFWADLPAD